MDLTKHSFKILNALATPILVIDRNYNIVGGNNSAYKLFGLSTQKIIDHKCFKITHKLDRPCWQEGTSCPTKTAFELKEQIRVIHKHIYKDKAVFEEISASPILDDKGKVDFIVEEFNDITKLIQSKEISKHLKKDIKTLQGLLPICAKCKNIRDEKGYWSQIESYISNHSDAQFSHGLCDKCSEELYGEKDWYIEMNKKEE